MSEQVTSLIDFLNRATTPFHAVKTISERLLDAGFEKLDAVDANALQAGGGYFLTRNDSSLVAFRVGRDSPCAGLRMVGAHTDSPNLSVKPNPGKFRAGVSQVGVDVYGGALLNPWFDRDLSLAGRVSFLNGNGQLQSRLVDFRKPIAIIPSLAIHLDREANKNRSINPQTDILPILASGGDDTFDLNQLLGERLAEEYPDCEAVRVLDFELSLYDTQPAAVIGLDDSLVASARLDNLLSCYAGLEALVTAETSQWSLLVCNDHEEVGSASAVGAQGPFLMDVLESLVQSWPESRQLRSASVMLSVDNAHALHPNFSDRHDDAHAPLLNGGPVVKINRNQRYATSGEGSALLRLLAERAEVPLQHFVVRTDLGCGSTIGPITATETGISTIDLGVPTLAMHSIRELAGTRDIDYIVQLLRAFYDRAA